MGRDGWFDRILRWGSADGPLRSSVAGRSVHSTEFELLEALERPVCAVCDRTRRAGERYVAGVVREGVNDPETRDTWRRRGGLCARHWRAFRSQESSPLPAAIVAEDLLATYLEAGSPDLDCPACEIEAIAQRRYLKAFERLEPDAVEEALERGRGFLCVHHLEGLAAGAVRERFQQRLHEVLTELAAFRRKQDYRFAHEPAGAERDAWLRAMRALGGDV
ncbi:MAG: hypothetical protein P8Y05_10390 [Deinococcales bacterium]